MSVVTTHRSTDRVVLSNIGWETYESLLKDLATQSSPRLAYDQGVLEIMSPYIEHDRAKEILAYIATIALEELDVDFEATGSTTFKREALKRGFEPDSSFYIQNAKRVRWKKRLDLEIDPLSELIIEIDITTESMNKFPIYSALGVSEVWRYEDSVQIWILQESRYVRHPASIAIPILNEALIAEFMGSSLNMERPAWARQTRQRIRELIA